MLKLEKVSKFKKQQSTSKKLKSSQKFADPYNDSSQNHHPQNQYSPQFIYNKFPQQQDSQCQQFDKYYNNAYSNRQFQDSALTMFLYKKITLIRSTMMSLGIISIFLSIFQQQFQEIHNPILILHSLISFGLVSMVILKYFIGEQLKIRQLLRLKYQNKYWKFIKSTSLQMLLLFLHPNIITSKVTIQVSEPIYGQFIPLNVNTFLSIIIQCRIYLLYLCIINSSIYCNTRAHRLCRIYSTKTNLFFGIKSLFQYSPLTFLIVLYISLVIVYGQMICLSQRDIQQEFQSFENSIWLIIITMGTVGYGDYSPKTYLGRVITFGAAISGIIISSLLILTLSRYLSMSNGQNKSHVTLKRLQLRRILEKYSKQTINFTTKIMFQSKLNSSNTNIGQNKKIMEQLKKKTQKVKFAIRRIKNLVDTDNLKQEINRLFQALSQSLNEIYKYQVQYSQLLMELYKKQKDTINQIQFSFTTQIQNVIKDR